MPVKHLFEYATIRVVPRVEREEFLNVGVVLFCPSEKFLQAKYELDAARLKAFCEKLDIDEIEGYLKALSNICQGVNGSGPIGLLPLADRFRWLTATRSTVMQTSKVHPGLCNDATETLLKLYTQLVL